MRKSSYIHKYPVMFLFSCIIKSTCLVIWKWVIRNSLTPVVAMFLRWSEKTLTHAKLLTMAHSTVCVHLLLSFLFYFPSNKVLYIQNYPESWKHNRKQICYITFIVISLHRTIWEPHYMTMNIHYWCKQL